MSNLTVTLYFEWLHASADPRQYNQQRTVLCPNVKVAIVVPLKHNYIHNVEEILQAQIAGNKQPDPILTPLGMVYADEMLRAAYSVSEHDEVDESEVQWENDNDELVESKLEDDEEFPLEEFIDSDEEELDEILWEN